MLGGRVRVELPMPVAEVINGVGEEIERLTGEAGLLIMKAVMDAEVEALAGPKGRHDPQRRATRWTSEGGYGVLAGKKVNVVKPRVRTPRGEGIRLQSYQRFQSRSRRARSVSRKLLAGISTRKYKRAIDDFTDGYGITLPACRCPSFGSDTAVPSCPCGGHLAMRADPRSGVWLARHAERLDQPVPQRDFA